jgi:hypothetical protein
MLHLGNLAAEGLLQLINQSIVASHGPDQAGCRKPIGALRCGGRLKSRTYKAATL